MCVCTCMRTCVYAQVGGRDSQLLFPVPMSGVAPPSLSPQARALGLVLYSLPWAPSPPVSGSFLILPPPHPPPPPRSNPFWEFPQHLDKVQGAQHGFSDSSVIWLQPHHWLLLHPAPAGPIRNELPFGPRGLTIQSVVPIPVALASAGSVLEMQHLRPDSRARSALNRHGGPVGVSQTLKFEKRCSNGNIPSLLLALVCLSVWDTLLASS